MVWCGAGDGAVGGLTAASIPGSAISTSARWDCLAKETDESAAIRISPSVLSSSFSVLHSGYGEIPNLLQVTRISVRAVPRCRAQVRGPVAVGRLGRGP